MLRSSLYEKYLQRDDLTYLGGTVIIKIDSAVIVEFVHKNEVWDTLAKNDVTIQATVNSLQVLLG